MLSLAFSSFVSICNQNRNTSKPLVLTAVESFWVLSLVCIHLLMHWHYVNTHIYIYPYVYTYMFGKQ